MKGRAWIILALAACGATALLGGCAADPTEGYSFQTGFARDVRTVQVPIFRNDSFDVGVETELTEAIVKEIRRNTGWTIDTAATADTTLAGTITGSQLRKLSVDRETGLVQELGVQISVDFELVDNRTGRTLVARRGFTAQDTFIAQCGVNERYETGRSGAIQRLAKDIVAELRTAW